MTSSQEFTQYRQDRFQPFLQKFISTSFVTKFKMFMYKYIYIFIYVEYYSIIYVNES